MPICGSFARPINFDGFRFPLQTSKKFEHAQFDSLARLIFDILWVKLNRSTA